MKVANTVLCIVVVIIMFHAHFCYSQHIFPEHLRSQCSAIRKSEIMKYIIPEVRQFIKELSRGQQEILDTIKGGFVLTCPYGWVYHDDNCYLFTQHRSTWQKMKEYCGALEGYLAEIRNREENEFVKQELRNIHQNDRTSSYFLGGTDRDIEGVWKWVRTEERIKFSDFALSEPNNYKEEDCLTLLGEKDFKWNDDQCISVLNGICKTSAGHT